MPWLVVVALGTSILPGGWPAQIQHRQQVQMLLLGEQQVEGKVVVCGEEDKRY